MQVSIGDTAPDFTAMTTAGSVSFHDWLDGAWCVIFSHPKDFTPVCTTELGAVSKLMPEFERRGVKIIGLSVDPVEDHLRWIEDIEEVTGSAPHYPIVGDVDLAVAKLYGMLPRTAPGTAFNRTAMDNATVRSVFVIAPDKTVKMMLTYPMSTGRDFGEILRVIDSLQMTAKHKVATPANWRQGDDVVILPAVSNSDAAEMFPEGWKQPKPYMRLVRQPA
ncbi:MAG: peroxiredoxin [Pseudomonadota bacterium]